MSHPPNLTKYLIHQTKFSLNLKISFYEKKIPINLRHSLIRQIKVPPPPPPPPAQKKKKKKRKKKDSKNSKLIFSLLVLSLLVFFYTSLF